MKLLPLGDYSGRSQTDSNVGGPCTLTCPQQIMGKKEGTHIQYSD